MKSGYKVEWTDNALTELKVIFEYIEQNWTEKELRRLSNEIERTINLISNNPNLFPQSENSNVRRTVVKKLNTIYYRIKDEENIEILSFFSNRKHPDKRQI